MAPTSKKCSQMNAFGVKMLYANHQKVRRLKKSYTPSNHGGKVWKTSWLLIDYLRRTRAIGGQRVMDLGCGWGLAGIYCAKRFGARVTAVDMDEDVYPYLQLTAEVNRVTVDFLQLDFNQVGRRVLNRTDVIIGADICFSAEMTDQLRRLILRAKQASVASIILCDPCRWPFEDLEEMFVGKKGVKSVVWEIKKPYNISGKILEIQFSRRVPPKSHPGEPPENDQFPGGSHP